MMKQEDSQYTLAQQTFDYRLMTKIDNNRLKILLFVKNQRSENSLMETFIQRHQPDSLQTIDIQAIQQHLKQPNSFKVSLEDKTFNIIKANVQILKSKLVIVQKNSLIQRALNQPKKLKKTLIVAGRMGHGKSSFINVLILPKQTKNLDILNQNQQQQIMSTGSGLESVTSSCALAKVHQSHKLLQNEDLYVIDTPGLNSEDAICLISEQIDLIITQQMCQIIGIAYVINLGADREIAGNKNSTLKKFMSLLKIEKKIKNQMVFFILSNWDNITYKHEPQQIKVCQQGLKKLIQQIQIQYIDQYIDNNVIKWVSTLSAKSKSLKYFLNQQNGQSILINQWKKLQYLTLKGAKKPLKFETHIQNVQYYWQKLINKIFSQIKSNNVVHKKQADIIQFQAQIDIEILKAFFGRMVKLSIIYVTATSLSGGIIATQGIAGVGLAVAFGTGVAAGAVVGSLAVIPLCLLAYALLKKKKITPSQQKNSPQHIDQVIKRKMIDQINKKLKLSILKSLIQSIKIKSNQIKLNKINSVNKYQKLIISYKNQNIKVPVVEVRNNTQIQNRSFEMVYEEYEKGGSKYEKQQIQKFQANNQIDEKTRLPQNVKFYIKKDQKKLKLSFQMHVKLPEQKNYYDILTQHCEQMFGKYS